MSEKSLWNWRQEGFFERPVHVPVLARVVVYRVWGGTATETGSSTRPGVCFSFEKPTTRRQAEGLLAVWEWGNACRYVTTFEILPGAVIFVGKVHPGDFYQSGLGFPGSQIFVETPQAKRFVRQIGQAQKLLDDVGSHVIVPNRDPGGEISS